MCLAYMAIAAEILWPYEKLPEWNAEELLRLFLLRRAGAATREQINELAKYLMVLISMSFARDKWIDTLDAGPGAADVANTIVMFILTRVNRFNFKKDIAKIPPADSINLMIKALNTAIHRRLLDSVAALKKHSQHSPDGMEEVLSGAVESDLVALEEWLCSEAVEAKLLVGVDGDLDASLAIMACNAVLF